MVHTLHASTEKVYYGGVSAHIAAVRSADLSGRLYGFYRYKRDNLLNTSHLTHFAGTRGVHYSVTLGRVVTINKENRHFYASAVLASVPTSP